VDLGPTTAEIYVRWAVTQMHAVVDRLDDESVSRAPFPRTNSVAALVTHCCGVGEFWLGHVGLGRPSDRDRDSEFVAIASCAELHARLDAAVERIVADVQALDRGEASPANAELRQFLQGGDETDASLVVHVIEELFQHLGHMQLTADALLGAGPEDEA
jgi:cysteine-S-conjugate beta-lyase